MKRTKTSERFTGSSRSGSRDGRSGFTLAELAVVVVLAGMVLTIVLPRFGGFGDREKLRTATRRLAGQALEAYSQAISKSRPWFFSLDLDKNRTWLSTVRPGEEGDTGRESRYYRLPRGVKFKDVLHPSKGLVKEGRLSFGYWPQGGGEPGTIHLVSDDGGQMTIFIRPYMGRTEIKKGYLREETQ